MNAPPPLRILHLEDNPLIVFHIEAMLEELGHTSAGSLSSFADLKDGFDINEVDGALVDIDLTDGTTGPEAAEWLQERGIPCIFVTGQSAVAAKYPDLALATLTKPVRIEDLAECIELFRSPPARAPG